jgi:DNA recombination protein RmuC
VDQLLPVIVCLLGLALGLALGWWLGARAVAEMRERMATREAELTARFDVRDAEARGLDDKFRRAISELATMSEKAAQAEGQGQELERLRAAHVQAQAQLAHHKAQGEAQERHFAEQRKALIEQQEALRREFEVIGQRALEQAQAAFLARAEARFTESEKATSDRLRTVLAPVGERLARYEEQVQALESTRLHAFGQLSEQIEAMRLGADQVRVEAMRLGNSLRNAPKARGRWGEQQLRNVLEQCGLSEHTDFVTEHSVNTEEGRLRPDAIVTIPGQKKLVIDAKVSLNAYQDAYEAGDETARDLALKAHVVSMRNHIQTLASKSYQSQFEDAPDYVLMFVPGEHFISAALEQDPTLWEYAFERRVLLASPTNLVAIARSVAQVWRQVGLEKEAREIGRMGGELYDRLAVAAEHLKRVGGGLNSAVENYNKFVGSFERNVLASGKRLRDKHIEIGKREIEDVPQVEAAPRHAEVTAPAALPWPEDS